MTFSDTEEKIDLILLSNGPGELLTWVKPMVQTLKNQMPEARINLVLSPCHHSNGKESEVAQKNFGLTRVLEPKNFLSFLLFGRTPENWSWQKKGLVLFLGGDQAFTWIIAKRLGYKSLIYAENQCRWGSLVDHFAGQKKTKKMRKKFQSKFSLVGDLSYEAVSLANTPLEYNWQNKKDKDQRIKQISLLPGSKPLKLKHCLPIFLGIVDKITRLAPSNKYSFVLYLAPALPPESLEAYIKQDNPYIKTYKGSSAKIIKKDSDFYLETQEGNLIYLYQKFPAYDQLAQSDLALSTVGTITKELGNMGIPMVILSPYMIIAHKLYDFDKWDGIMGILARVPVLGKIFIRIFCQWALKHPRLLALPNSERKKEIVPEVRGAVTSLDLTKQIKDLLADKEKLKKMREELLSYGEENLNLQKPSEEIVKIIKNLLVLEAKA